MTTFAHLAPDTSEVLDPREFETVDQYKESFGGVAETTWSAHVFKEVPAGTLHGATENEDGTYTNPEPASAEPSPRALTKAQFQSHLADFDNDLSAALAAWPVD